MVATKGSSARARRHTEWRKRYSFTMWDRIHSMTVWIEGLPAWAVLLAAGALLLLPPLFSFSRSRLTPRRRRRPDAAGQLRVWRIGWALAASILAALISLTAITWAALALLHFPHFPRASTIRIHDLVSVLQLVFASVAGAGALVALVMAYRRQKVAEVTSQHDRIRLLNDRFTAIATQLGDTGPAVRMAGVYAMAGLADDWEENRQTCIDVLCAYLRMPYHDGGGDPSPGSPPHQGAEHEIRQTVLRLVAAHLREKAAVRWDRLDFDFTGVLFDDDVDFSGIILTSGNLNFKDAVFQSGSFSFRAANFIGGTACFSGARFTGASFILDFASLSSDAYLNFDNAEFASGKVSFRAITLDEASDLPGTRTLRHAPGMRPGDWAGRPYLSFDNAAFNGTAVVAFEDAKLLAGMASFTGIIVSSGELSFDEADFGSAAVSFGGARFSGGTVSFEHATFTGRPSTLLPRSTSHLYRHPREGTYNAGGRYVAGTVSFEQACFDGATVRFAAHFNGGNIDFEEAVFSGGTVSFENAAFSRRYPRVWDDVPGGGQPGAVTFRQARFTGARVVLDSRFEGGIVDFSSVAEWSFPPEFGSSTEPQPGLKLPQAPMPSIGSDPA